MASTLMPYELARIEKERLATRRAPWQTPNLMFNQRVDRAVAGLPPNPLDKFNRPRDILLIERDNPRDPEYMRRQELEAARRGAEGQKPVLQRAYENRKGSRLDEKGLEEEARGIAEKTLGGNREYRDAVKAFMELDDQLTSAQEGERDEEISKLTPNWEAAKKKVDGFEKPIIDDLMARFRKQHYESWVRQKLWGEKPTHKKQTITRMLRQQRKSEEEEEPQETRFGDEADYGGKNDQEDYSRDYPPKKK
jgi:hypothetical protein